MPVNIESTTDTPEAVLAAAGKTVEAKVEDTPAVIEETAETKEASGTSTENDLEAEVKEKTADEKAAGETQEKVKKKGGYQRKINKLTAKVSDAEQRALYWQQEALRNQKPSAEKTDAKVEAKVDGKPQVDKFETHEEYVEALADWKVEQKLSARDLKSREVAAKVDSDKMVSSHIEKVKTFAKDHEDFNELMESVDDIPMSITVQQVILDSENGPELMYQLAKNREEYERICKLPAIAAARELGKFEAKLAKSSTSSETTESKTTKAPAPISPVGKGKVASTKDPDDMTFQEYKRYRAAQT